MRLLSLVSFTFAIIIGSASAALAAPVITVTPDSLHENLLTGETALRTVTVSNSGTTALNFSVSFRPNTVAPVGGSTQGTALARTAQQPVSSERLAGIMDEYAAFLATDVSTEFFEPEMNVPPAPLLSTLQGIINAMSDTSIVFFDNFEGDTIGWRHYAVSPSVGDQWSKSSSRSSSGSFSWNVSQHSGVGADALQTPTIDLTPYLNATLAFQHWYNFDDCGGDTTFEPDGGIVEVSTDNGASWTQIFPVGGYPYTLDDICGNPLRFFDAYSHDGEGSVSGQFIPAVFDLSAFVGSSIQIRFQAGWDCGNCGFNEGWFIDDVTIFTENFVSWLSAAPDTATVIPGGSVDVNVTFNATGLPGGDYLADIVLTSDDPVTPELLVPASMHVTGAPDISVSETALTFPSLFVGFPHSLTFVAQNIGSDILTVSSITSSHSDFSVDISAMTLNPGDSQTVTVTFTPSTVGVLNETLTIVSDDPLDPTTLISLSGEGLNPPIISATPDSLDDSLLTGETALQTLTIQNSGGSDLNYGLTVFGSGFAGTILSPGQALSPNQNDLFKRPVDIEPHPTANDSTGASFRRAAAGTYTGTNLSFGISDFGEILPFEFPVGNGHLAFGAFISGYFVAYQVGGTEFNAYAEFHERSALTPVSFTEVTNDPTRAVIEVVIRTADNVLELTRTFTFIKDQAAVGIETEIRNISGGPVDSVDFKCLADFDVDGSFAGDTFAYDPTHNLAYASETHFVGLAGSTPPDFRDLDGWNDRLDRLTDGNIPDGPATFDGLALLHYQRGTLPTGAHTTLATVYGAGNSFSDLQSAIEQGLNQATWLELPVTAGTVPASSSENIALIFNATGLFGGDYFASISITSNDSATPELVIPAHLNVTGAPDISTSETALIFPPLFVGFSHNLTFVVKNVGTDVLTVSSITSSSGDFSASASAMTLNPGETQPVTVTFTPSTAGIVSETLTITSDDPADPVTLISLNGEGLVPPVISVTPDSLDDSLLTGETALHTLTIHNTGGSDLNYELDVFGSSFPGTASPVGRSRDPNLSQRLRAPAYVEPHPTANDSSSSYYRITAAGTYTGTNLSFGISDLGEIMPFQSPVGNEHLAIGSFVSGYLVAYSVGGSERLAYAEFNPRSSISPVSFTEVVNDSSRAVVRVVTRTADNALEITRTFTFVKSGFAVGIRTEISNISGGLIDSVDVKCLVDFDVDGTFEGDTFAYDPSHNLAYAYEAHFVGVAGSAPPDFRDLDGWNDRFRRLTDGNIPDGPAAFDGLAMLHYQRGSLTAGATTTIATAFGVGNTLVELQAAIEGGVNLASWLNPATTSGTIPAGSSEDVAVTFDASGLFGGNYFAVIRINSNDPATPDLQAPAHLFVTGAPDITLSDTALDFDSLFIGSFVTRVFTVSNVGTDILNVTGISSDQIVYSSDVSVFSLNPGESQDVTITFLPTSAGVMNGTITITSNDADTPTSLVLLTGKGLIPPEIVIAPDSTFDSLLTGEVAVHPLTISNNGGSDLSWKATITNPSVTPGGLFTLTVPDPNAASAPADSGEVVSQSTQESFRTTASQATLADLTGVKILYDRAHGQGSASSWSTIISDLTLRGATVTESFSPVTLTLLQDVDIYWTTDVSISWSASELTALTAWVDGGGGLLLEGDNTSTVPRYNDILNALGAGITFSATDGSSGTTSAIFPHPTTENVASIVLSANIARISSITAPAGPLVSDVSGIWNSAFSEVVSGRIVAMADEVFFDGRMGFADNQLFANQVFDWLANTIRWVKLDTASGVVIPGQSEFLNITLDATGLFGGVYLADVVITSNDPVDSVVSAATSLRVTGVPDISVSPLALDFDSLFIGLSSTLQVSISNLGTDVLTITGITSDNADFSTDITTFTLPPLGAQALAITFTPTTLALITGSLTISSDDPDEPTVAVSLQGVGLIPPDIAVTPDSISEIMFPLDSISKTITIQNNGGSDLIWSASVRGASGTAASIFTLTPPAPGYPGSSSPFGSELPTAPERTSSITATLKDLTGVSIMFDLSHGQPPLWIWGILRDDLILRGADVSQNTATIDASSLAGIDILWITRPSSSLSVSERTALANWTLAGGALAIFNDETSSYSSFNTLLSDLGSGIQLNSAIFGCACDIVDIHPHEITAGVSSLRVSFAQPTLFPVTSPGVVLFDSPTGPPVCAVSSVGFGRIMVSSELMFYDARIGDADNQLFINQAFDWLAGGKWLTLSATSGVIPASSSGLLTATIDASVFKKCSDSGQVVISSNDPDQPEVNIPVKVEIDRLPQCFVPNDTTIFYCETQEFRLPAFGLDSCDPVGVVCEVISGPGVIETGEWVYTPVGDEIANVTVRCTDSRGNSCESSFTITFDINEAPLCVLPVDTTIFLCEPTKVRLPVFADDPDGNLVESIIVGGPGALENDKWVYMAPTDQFTLARIRFTDSCGAFCEKLFRVDFDVNSPPSLVCPPDTNVHFNTVVQLPVSATDPELTSFALEELTYSLGPGSPDFASINPTTGVITLAPKASDICEHTVSVVATDYCGAADTCTFVVCVENTPPVITCDSIPTSVCWGQLATGVVSASDSDNGPVSPFYTVVDFDGPGTVTVDLTSGAWSWQTEEDSSYIGRFNLCISAADGAGLCDPCSPQNADTCCIEIIVTPTYRVTIETVNNAIQGGPVDVAISLADWYESYPLAGYDFLIDYDASALVITGAIEGAFIPGNDWEYFTYRFGPSGNCGSGCPSGKFRVIALANLNNGASFPSGFTNTSAGSNVLALLQFQVSNNRTFECQLAPINWSWYDCGDNSISSVSGDSLFISRFIYHAPLADSGGVFTYEFGDGGLASIHDPNGSFPTLFGAPLECEVGGGPGKPVPIRKIDFANGGVKIACADSIDARGDINLNGLPNEIADAVVFTTYFVQGLSAFNINPDGQTAATEINGDGIPLSVSDLVYLIRIIVGDALPLPKLNHYAHSVSITDQGGEISTDTELGAALFVFEGVVDVDLLQDNLALAVGLRNGNTYALVTPIITASAVEAGRIETGAVLQAGGALLSVETADYYGSALTVNSTILPNEFTVRQNYPNPFNPSTKISFDLPEPGLYSVVIYNVVGQRITEFSGESGPGTIEVMWDAGSSASGVYFYRVKAGRNSVTRKMLLLK